jgi:hypothetical protein
MEITFNPVKLRGPLWRLPEITTNGVPEKKKVRIEAYVYKPDTRLKFPIDMPHPRIDLPQYGDEIIDSARLEIKNISRHDLHLTLIEYPGEIDITWPEFIKAGGTASAVVHLKKSARGTNFWKSITFEVNDEQHSRFSIPVEQSQRLPGIADPETD